MIGRLRPWTAATAVLAVAPALVLLPTVDLPSAGPAAVSGSVTSFAVTGVDGAALRTQSVGPLERRPLVLTAQRSTSRFDLVALTWSGALPAGTTMQVRVREAGQWTGWQELEPSEHAPDPGDEGAGTAAPSCLLYTSDAADE